MVRCYKKKIGINFKNYNEENIARALEDIRQGRKSVRQAAEYYRVPKSTLHDKKKGIKTKNHGGQPVISQDEEKLLAKGILQFSEWGFPLTRQDMRSLVKSYLDRKGAKIKQFKDNYPGIDWFYKFISRNKILTERFAQNIKRSRANITKEIIESYFLNLRETIENIPPSNIINYDESNLSDDPGRVKVLCKRGSKRVERIVDSSKSSISIMMAISGSGVLLPPYVVYKSVHLYPTWVEGGPDETVYNRTKSGWFDTVTFDDWFDKILLPYCRKLPGRKVLIGDNLAAHTSMHVLRCCEQNDISFVLLPPNGTHLLQPLDVSFFGPFKKVWRSVLADWKLKNRGCIVKSEFPALLRKSIEGIENMKTNIMSGFRACGIVPLSPDAVLKKIPDPERNENNNANEEHWTNSLKEFLHESRLKVTGDATKKKRGKKLQVAAGKGISSRDMDMETSESEAEIAQDDTSEDEELKRELESDNENDQEGTEEMQDENNENLCPQNQSGINETDPAIRVQSFVVVKFTCNAKNKYYIGCVTEVIKEATKEIFLVNFLRKQNSNKIAEYFLYPIVKDESLIDKEQIVKVLKNIKDLRRQRYNFPELSSLKNIKIE